VVFWLCGFYGRFLSNSTVAIAIAMIMATVEMVKYVSVGGKVTVGYGDAVGAGALAVKDVSALDG
jgi:hypothetical protein